MELAKEQIAYGLSKCDLLKISEEELEFMTVTKDVKEGAQMLLSRYPNLKLMNVTMGKEGSTAFHEGREVFLSLIHISAGSEIKVHVFQKDGFVWTEIADNGNGVADADKNKLFQMFYTAENQKGDGRRCV